MKRRRVLCALCFVIVTMILASCTQAYHEIYFTDFEGRVGDEWSSQATGVTPDGQERFLGQFGKWNDLSWIVGIDQIWPVGDSQAVALRLDDLPPHYKVRVTFDLYVIGGWEGDVSAWYGPGIWSLSHDPGDVLLETTFSNVAGTQTYPDSYPGRLHSKQTGAVAVDVFGYIDHAGVVLPDAVYTLEFAFPHSVSTLTLNFESNVTGGIETWGLDNVTVQVLREGYSYLEISSSKGGGVLIPGEGSVEFPTGTLQHILAVSDDNESEFVTWVGSAVTRGQVINRLDPNTLVIADDDSTGNGQRRYRTTVAGE